MDKQQVYVIFGLSLDMRDCRDMASAILIPRNVGLRLAPRWTVAFLWIPTLIVVCDLASDNCVIHCSSQWSSLHDSWAQYSWR